MGTGNGSGNGHNGRYTAEQVATAIRDAEGFVTRAARALKCNPRTIYNYAKRYVTVQRAIDDAREERIDWVEDHLFGMIEKDNVTAMIFYLKCQAKHRGYIEKQQIEHSGDGSLVLKVVYETGTNGTPPAPAPEAG